MVRSEGGTPLGLPLVPDSVNYIMDRISRNSQGVEGVRFDDFRIGLLLSADNVVPLAPSGSDLQRSLDWLTPTCEAAGMISTFKSEAMVLSWKRWSELVQAPHQDARLSSRSPRDFGCNSLGFFFILLFEPGGFLEFSLFSLSNSVIFFHYLKMGKD